MLGLRRLLTLRFFRKQTQSFLCQVKSHHVKRKFTSGLNCQCFALTSILMASVTSSVGEHIVQLRLEKVPGDGDKVNDIFVYGTVQDCKEHIIYFGGDVQDYPENMERHRDNKRYVKWNTQNTAALLQHKFPSSLVFAIKASRMHLLTFAVYSNFVETNDFGGPVHNDMMGAIRHLWCLYKSAVQEAYGKTGVDPCSSIPIRLIGFSKGCVVLNQIVFELHVLDEDEDLRNFMKQIKAFYWLDGGHSGGKENTWVTDSAALKRLASLDSEIFIHITPYQVRDALRKWIGQQETKFHLKLRDFHAKVQEREHFESEPGSIENHFRVLEEF